MEESLRFLERMNTAYELIQHSAVFTIDEAEAEPALWGRVEVKNLFVQDDKGKRQHLIMMPGRKKLDLKMLARDIGEKKIRFCSSDKVKNMLGVEPGSVSVFCCLNESSQHINIVVDEELFQLQEIGLHPIVNTATVFINSDDLKRLLSALPQKHIVVKL